MRGGTANCTVIISDELIGSPIVENPDFLIVMSEASLNKFQSQLKKHGMLLFDSSLIKAPLFRYDIEVVAVPATEIASKNGNTKSANMVLLGAFIAMSGIVNKTSIFEALERTIAAGNNKSIEMNKKAISEGIRFIENTKGTDI